MCVFLTDLPCLCSDNKLGWRTIDASHHNQLANVTITFQTDKKFAQRFKQNLEALASMQHTLQGLEQSALKIIFVPRIREKSSNTVCQNIWTSTQAYVTVGYSGNYS